MSFRSDLEHLALSDGHCSRLLPGSLFAFFIFLDLCIKMLALLYHV